jgi:hypothetical protein
LNSLISVAGKGPKRGVCGWYWPQLTTLLLSPLFPLVSSGILAEHGCVSEALSYLGGVEAVVKAVGTKAPPGFATVATTLEYMKERLLGFAQVGQFFLPHALNMRREHHTVVTDASPRL